MFVFQRTPDETRSVKSFFGQGLSDYEIARRTNVSRSTIQRWRTRGVPRRTSRKIKCAWRPAEPRTYSYMLGIYLGDGYVAHAYAQSPVLEISLDPKYPKIVDECSASIWRLVGIRATASRRKTPRGQAIRLVAASHLWPSVFPQHGPGKKHEREISLASWQQAAVDRFPGQFVRGLIHADGCRVINRFQIDSASGLREYAYPRYFFTNLSNDIQGLFCASCDQLGVRWTQASYKNISVAHRKSVALLDAIVGPKS
jgi:hypothetical protein